MRVLILVAFLFSPYVGFSLTCENLFKLSIPHTDSKNITGFAKVLSDDLLQITDLSNVFEGKQRPDWKHYQTLSLLIEKIDVYLKENQQNTLSEKDIEFLKSKLQKWALDYHQIAKKTAEAKNQNFIQFVDVNYAFFKLLEQFNKLVDLNVFPDYFIQFLPAESVLTEQAIDTVQKLKKINQEFYSTTGYADQESFRQSIQKHSKQYAETLKLVDQDLVVAIHRPESARFWIPRAGIQNQRITGSSKGSLNPDFRNIVESQLIFQSQKSYKSKSVRYMPNYGEVRPAAKVQNYKPNIAADRYGSDLWIVKKSIYDDRVTWTPRDSFSQPRVKNKKQVTSWDHMFIPWSSREIMVPYNHGQKYMPEGYRTFYPGPVHQFKLQGNIYGFSYFETQIWGPLSLNDIEAFHFKKTPPDKKFYELLISKGIKVYDERTWPAKIYNGEESK